MSIKLMTQVWESGLPRAKKYIALVYADWANDDGNSIFPSVGHVAWKCGCGERTVQYVTEKLEADGILKYIGESKYRTNEYQMIASKLPKRKPYKEKGAKIAPMTPQKLHPNGAKIAPDPLVTHQIEPLVKEIAADAARPTGTNGVVVFGGGQEYTEIKTPVFTNSCAWCGGIGRHEKGCEIRSQPKPPTSADVETMFNLLKEGTPSAYEEVLPPHVSKNEFLDDIHDRYSPPLKEEVYLDWIGETKRPSPHRQMVEALSLVTGFDPKLHGARLGKAASKLLKAGYTHEYLKYNYEKRHVSFSQSWWYAEDWRGKKGEMPTPEQVIETIGKVKVQSKAQPTPSLPSEEELNRQRADVAAKVAERDAKRKAGIQDPDDF